MRWARPQPAARRRAASRKTAIASSAADVQASASSRSLSCCSGLICQFGWVIAVSVGNRRGRLGHRTDLHINARLCGMGSAIPELDALLARHHIDLTGDDVLDEIDAAFAAIPTSGAATLSAPEVEFLAAHGGPETAGLVKGWSPSGERQARARVALRALSDAVAGSVSTREAAEMLGVDRSRISRRITGNALWAFDIRGQRRIPRWQFVGGGLLPGLDVIVAAIPRDATPAVLDAFMQTPQPDFDDRTPIEYLAGGGDPGLVAGFIRDLARW